MFLHIDSSSPHAVLAYRILSLILLTIMLGFGLHSHFNSAWVKEINIAEGVSIKLYSICSLSTQREEFSGKSCPDIAMERYCVAVIIICYVLSFAFLFASFVKSMKSGRGMLIDVGHHVVSGLALISAGIVYIVSAIQIRSLFDGSDFVGQNVHFRYEEKRLVTVLAIIQGAFYTIAMSTLIYKRASRDEETSHVHGDNGVIAESSPQEQYSVVHLNTYIHNKE